MPSCVVKCCKNNTMSQKKDQGITFHRFPSRNDPWKKDWVNIIRKCRCEENWIPSKSSVICSLHFDSIDFYSTKKGYLRIIEYAVPKKFLYEPPKMTDVHPVERNKAAEKRPSRKWTWMSPNGSTRNEIDVIMRTKKRIFNYVSVIAKVKTGSNHRISQTHI